MGIVNQQQFIIIDWSLFNKMFNNKLSFMIDTNQSMFNYNYFLTTISICGLFNMLNISAAI